MPYIKKEKREILDPTIDALHQVIINLELDDPDSNNTEGNMNYIISTLIEKVYSSRNYREINDAVGMLDCCKMEFYRKVAAPYEDTKEYENGSVYASNIKSPATKE